MRNGAICTLITLLSVIMLTGCGDGKIEDIEEKHRDKILKILQMAAKRGAIEGLKAWAKKDEAAAKEAAEALARNLKDEILPYLDGEELHTSAEVNEFINSSLFKNIPDEIKDAIVAAAVVLDVYLPIPSSENLNEVHKAYLKAFLIGLQEGSATFLGKMSGTDVRYWITGQNKKVGWLSGKLSPKRPQA
jgi:hypothetical protein